MPDAFEDWWTRTGRRTGRSNDRPSKEIARAAWDARGQHHAMLTQCAASGRNPPAPRTTRFAVGELAETVDSGQVVVVRNVTATGYDCGWLTDSGGLCAHHFHESELEPISQSVPAWAHQL